MSITVEIAPVPEKAVPEKAVPEEPHPIDWTDLTRFGTLFLVAPIYLVLAVLYAVSLDQYGDELSVCDAQTRHHLYFRTAFTSAMVLLAGLYAIFAQRSAATALAVTMGLIWVGGCCTWALVPSGCSVGDTFYDLDDLASLTVGVAVEFDYWLHYVSFIIGCCVLGLYCLGAMLSDICRG